MGLGLLFLVLLLTLLLVLARAWIRRTFLPGFASRITIPTDVPLEIEWGPAGTADCIVVVTGANGFVGRYVVESFLAERFYVVATDVLTPLYTNPRCLCVGANLCIEQHCEALLGHARVGAVVHLAGIVDTRDLPSVLEANVTMAANLTRAIGSRPIKLVSLSSVATFAEKHSAYGRSKKRAEDLVTSMGGMSLRSGKVFGCGDTLGTDYLMEEEGGYAKFVVKGSSQYPIIYVKDLAALVKRAIGTTDYGAGKVVHVGHLGVTWRAFADEFVVMTSSGRVIDIPGFVAEILAYLMPLADAFVSLCLGAGRVAPQAAWNTLNPVTLHYLMDAPAGWDRAEWHTGELTPFTEAVRDCARMRKLQVKEKQFPNLFAVTAHDCRLWVSAKVGSPTTIMQLRNRIVKAATFEALGDSTGLPLPRLVDWHAGIAKSGVALTTVAYGAVSAGARSFDNQVVVDKNALPMLAKLTAAVHAHGGRVSLQLTHAGFFALGDAMGPSAFMFDPLRFRWARQMQAPERARVVAQFVEAAKNAQASQFDCVEIHCGHGYLLSQYLSPSLNRRTDEYGIDKALFPLEVIRAVRKAISIPVLVKFNLVDEGGASLQLRDSASFALRLQEEGLADALIPSGGLIMSNGLYMLRGPPSISSMMSGARTSFLMKVSLLIAGPFIVAHYPFSDAFFLDACLYLKRRGVKLPIVVTGGIQNLHTAIACLRYFDFVGMARALLNDGDLVSHWKRGETKFQTCDQNNSCVSMGPFHGKPPCCIKYQTEAW